MTLAPTAIGGPVSYVVTDGVSMLPHFRADGLVITRAADAYGVGEVVAYHNREMHTVVMHRIVAIQGGRFVFKGDNNPFADEYHARQADLIGREWMYWPSAGRYFSWLRSPGIFGLLIAAATLVAVGLPRRSRRRRRHHVA